MLSSARTCDLQENRSKNVQFEHYSTSSWVSQGLKDLVLHWNFLGATLKKNKKHLQTVIFVMRVLGP